MTVEANGSHWEHVIHMFSSEDFHHITGCVNDRGRKESLYSLAYALLTTHNASMNTRLPYIGDSRKLLLAFDLGTTYSGISYR